VADNFDVVAVGIEDECAVVIRMVLGSQSWCAVVSSSRSKGGLMKGIHQRTFSDLKGSMNTRIVWFPLSDPKIRLRRLTKTCDIGTAGNGCGKFE
jgi:hypothetical protein